MNKLRNWAAWRINVWFSEKHKPWYKDKGLMAFLYQELIYIDSSNTSNNLGDRI